MDPHLLDISIKFFSRPEEINLFNAYLELPVLYSSFIFSYTLRHEYTIFRREALGSHRTIWKPPSYENPPEKSYTPKQLNRS